MADGVRPGPDPATVARAVEAFGYGLGEEGAAALLGVDREVLLEWIRRGAREQRRVEDGEEPTPSEAGCMDFCVEVRCAAAKHQVEVLRALRRAGEQRPDLMAWFLERRYPRDWGPPEVKELLALRRQVRRLLRLLRDRGLDMPD